MLTINFNRTDLMRTRMAAAPDPLWELVLSLHQLRPPCPLIFRPWRMSTLSRLKASGTQGCLKILYELVPPAGNFPDFLTPVEAQHGFEAGLEAIMGTTKARLQDDLRQLGSPQPWVRRLAEGDREMMAELAKALRQYQAAAIEPYQTQIRASVHIDRTRRARSLALGGLERVLEAMRPTVRWSDTAIEAEYPLPQTCHLDGRGILLVPSFFCWGRPVTLRDTDLPPVMVYPIEGDTRYLGLGSTTYEAGENKSLTALLGRSRAAVLEALAGGSTTTGLARKLRLSKASVSEHVSVLRQAGLASSVREGASVVHTLTAAGSSFLGSSQA